jgi:hypothetical protein
MTAFRDCNFKLLVVEKLMYWDRTLLPEFGLLEFIRERGVEDLHEYAAEHDLEYQVFDEAGAYFEALEMPAELLATVEELTFDGGHQVYMECAPVRDGEDDLFDVRSLADLDLLPNPKVFTGARALEHMLPGAKETLAARGITGRYQARGPAAPRPRDTGPRRAGPGRAVPGSGQSVDGPPGGAGVRSARAAAVVGMTTVSVMPGPSVPLPLAAIAVSTARTAASPPMPKASPQSTSRMPMPSAPMAPRVPWANVRIARSAVAFQNALVVRVLMSGALLLGGCT